MKKETIAPFTGFSGKTIEFFLALRFNNEKPWFQAHRQEFEDYVLKPFQQLVTTLAPAVLAIDPQLDVTPKVDKTIARIYRDTRFSADKSPYRSNLWLHFRRPRADWKDLPGLYFELTPEYYHYGMGYFQPERPTMDNFRAQLDFNPDEFLRVTEFYRRDREFTLGGDLYKRALKPQPPEIAEWYNRKTFWLFKQRPLDNLPFEAALATELADSFTRLKPLYQYLWQIRKE